MEYIYIQTILIYSILTILMVLLARQSVKTGKNIYIYIALLAYSVLFGLRYGVGRDFFSYHYYFEDLFKGIYTPQIDVWEIGFVSITKFISYFNLSPPYYFGIIAFFQLSLFVSAVKDKRYILPSLFLVFMIGAYWLSFANLLRHILAIGFWTVSLKYAFNRKLIWHYLFVFLAISMHKSSWILIVFYPFIHFVGVDWFKKTSLCLCILGISLICMHVGVIQNIVSRLDILISYLGYDYYLENYEMENEVSIGLGFLITLILNTLTILYGEKVKAFYKDNFVSGVYSFFIIGVFFKYTFISSMLFARINCFFSNMSVFVYAFVLYYLYKCNKVNSYYYLTLLLLTFMATIYKAEVNTSLYIFNWQEEFFYLKRQVFGL